MAEAKKKTKKKAGKADEPSAAPPPEAPDLESPAKKGAPKWVVTFSDLMSLLMCFFIMLLSMSEIDIKKFKAMLESHSSILGVLVVVLIVAASHAMADDDLSTTTIDAAPPDECALAAASKPLRRFLSFAFLAAGDERTRSSAGSCRTTPPRLAHRTVLGRGPEHFASFF